ncbi:MAG: sporulation protein YabP [Clostridia bacterium]|nr:sporulation protein YabP [Clostridia bacterium]
MNDAQNLVLQNRSALSVTGVTDVFGFDDTVVSMVTTLGDLQVKGNALRISRLSLDVGQVDIEGTVDCVEYTKLKRKRESFLARVFK